MAPLATVEETEGGAENSPPTKHESMDARQTMTIIDCTEVATSTNKEPQSLGETQVKGVGNAKTWAAEHEQTEKRQGRL